MLTFVIGGMTGVLLAVPPADYVLHNSLFLVAHFHNVIIGGVAFGIFAAMTYWFPKAFGFKLEPFWGKVSFWCWLIGFYLAFMPLYVLGLMGVTRRLSQFQDTIYAGYFIVALVGALFVAAGIAAFLIQIFVSVRNKEALRDTTGDPWNGRTLEWSTASPPPYYNFAFTPRVHRVDAWWHMKQAGYVRPTENFEPIHMPRYTASGVILSALFTVLGFAMVWHVWWLAAIMLLVSIAYGIDHTFNYDRDYYVDPEEVAEIEGERTLLLAGELAPGNKDGGKRPDDDALVPGKLLPEGA